MIVLTFVVFPSIAVRAKKGKKKTPWIGIVAYTFQIYFDFSGYSDMAIGLGKMFGFHINENFNYPYIATSIKDFWRRWHISLSTWFKEYLYIPLGGNREGKFKTYRNLMIVFFMTGLWHGASWNFVVWGLFHGVFLVLERMLPIEKFLRFRLIQNIYALLVVMVGWVFFRAENLTAALDYLKRMFVPYKTDVYSAYLSNEFMMVAALGLVSCGFLTLIFDKLPVKTEYKFGFLRLVNPAWCAVIAYFSVLLLDRGILFLLPSRQDPAQSAACSVRPEEPFPVRCAGQALRQ